MILKFGMNPPYVLPDSTEVQSLEFPWDPYDRVWFFSSSRSFQESADWFARHLPDGENTNPDEGKLEFYFTDARHTDWSILVADARNRSSVNDLTSYVGSTRLTQRATNTVTGVVVVLFKHKKTASKR